MPLTSSQEPQFYSSRDVRELFGAPGRPICKTTLRRYRNVGVKVPGNPIPVPFPYVRQSESYYLYPKEGIDALLALLRRVGTIANRRKPTKMADERDMNFDPHIFLQSLFGDCWKRVEPEELTKTTTSP